MENVQRLTPATDERLKTIVERIERLEEEKTALVSDIKEVYSEARGAGYDVKAIKQVVSQRKLDSIDRQEQISMFELYWDRVH